MAIDRTIKKDILRKIRAKIATVQEMSTEYGIPRNTIYIWMRENKIKVSEELKYIPTKTTADVHTREIIDASKDQLIEKLLNNLDKEELQFVELILSNYGYQKAYSLVWGEPEKKTQVYAKLREPRIQKALIKLNSDLLAHFEIETIPTLIQDLNNILTFDWVDLIDDKGDLKSLHETTPQARKVIKKIEKDVVVYAVGTDDEGNRIYESRDKYKIETYDKLKATDLLAKIYKLYDDRATINNTTINNHSEGLELIKGLNDKFKKKPKIVNAKIVD